VTEKMKNAFVPKGFTANDDRLFETGSVLALPQGEFDNYAFAGKVREATAEEVKAAKAAETKAATA
jgi:hypothetical protein